MLENQISAKNKNSENNKMSQIIHKKLIANPEASQAG